MPVPHFSRPIRAFLFPALLLAASPGAPAEVPAPPPASAGLAPAPAPDPAFRVLIFVGMKGHVHNSYRHINRVWDTLSRRHNFAFDTSNSGAVFHPDSLKKYHALVFNNNTHIGNALNAQQKAVFLEWVKTRGFLGMHGAADANNTWPELSAWMGGELSVHSGTDSATMDIDTGDFARNHPIVKDQALPLQVRIREEWYSFKVNPRTYPGMRVLYTVDEKTFRPGVAMGDHPIVWVKEHAEGGRMVYMGMGHEDNLFFEDRKAGYDFVSRIMLSSLKWAAGAIPAKPIAAAPPAPRPPGPRIRMAGPGRVSVAHPDGGDFTVTLSSLDGRRVATRAGRAGEAVEVTGLRSGVYLVRLAGEGVPLDALFRAP